MRFLYDGASLIAEHNGSNFSRRYVHGPGMDEPIVWYERNGGGSYDRRWFVADERGSIIAIVNDAGAATNINAYDEYGQPASGNTGRFQYTGQIWLSEIGLYHYRARAYDPRLGRFLQTDPIGFAGGMNLYAYVGNDPLNAVDPWGLQSFQQNDEPHIVVTGWGSTSSRNGDLQDALNDWIVQSNIDNFFRSRNIHLDMTGVAVLGDMLFVEPAEDAVRAAQQGDVNTAATMTAGAAAGVVGGRLIDRILRRLCCFVAGTLVDTPDGLRPIETIEVGDLVLSRDETTGETAYKPVTAATPGHERILWDVTVAVDGREARFGTTDEHPWRTVDGRWLRTDELGEGMLLQRAEGEPARVVLIENTGAIAITYNLEVAGFHTYFVGEDRVWVHNCNWRSVLQFGHTFNRHGQGQRRTDRLAGRAAGTGTPQGQWLNNQQAAEFLSGLQLSGDATVFLPRGMGQIIMPNGSIMPASRATVIVSETGIKTAFPIP